MISNLAQSETVLPASHILPHRATVYALVLALLVLAVGLPRATSAQSGRQPSAQESGKQGVSSRPQEPKSKDASSQDSRPRRVGDDQDDKPITLSSDLVTVITSVTDATGNQVNDLTEKDFIIYEDGEPQEVEKLYRENQLPLRLVFLFDTSISIRHRFDFEQRAAAQFFRHLMRPGDQAAIISVSNEPKLETQFTSSIDQLTG
ncbi:MAG TPA: VWA domain-containing protein, partial [Blastocatellia bacterium]|nr:VWA domain-containing protein [Blastocatellia bacterium]